jgi:hypothetical protein
MDVAKTTAYNGTIESSDTIADNTVAGSIVGGRDSYVYTGEVRDIDIPSSVKLFKNGTEINPGTLFEKEKINPLRLPNTMIIHADTSERQDYGFSVTGDLATGPNANPDSADRAANGYGRGYVALNGFDDYVFSGELESISDFTCIQVDVNQEQQILTVRDLTGSVNPPYGYEVTVSGKILKGDGNNNATINGGTASGMVAGKTDVFSFTGDIREIHFPTSLRAELEKDIRQEVGYKNYQLKRQHGTYHYEIDLETSTEMIERGHFVFHDGTKIPVETELVANSKIRYTIDGEDFKLGGEWP